MKVRVYRSKEWVAARRLETAKNVPESILVDVEPTTLSQAARAVVLAASDGSYPTGDLDPGQLHLRYNDRYRWGRSSWHGCHEIQIDSDDPSIDQIEAEILRADAVLAEKRAKADAERRDREESERRLKEARELLAGELASKDAQIKELQADRLTLAEFLARVPADAKRGTLKAMARDAEAVETLRKKVEDAAPGSVWVLDDIDEEEAEDEE